MTGALIAALVGGFGFWLRGAARFFEITGRGATTSRIAAWAIPMGLLAWLSGASPAVSAALGVAMWVGCLAPWCGSIDLGRVDGTWGRDALRQAARGLLWTLPAGLVLVAAGSPIGGLVVALSGLAALPAYEVGWLIRPVGSSAPGATEVGEFLTGAAVGLTLRACLLTY